LGNAPRILKELIQGKATGKTAEQIATEFADKATKLVKTKSLLGLAVIMEINDARYLTLIINHYENKGYKKLEEYIEFLNNHRRFTEKDREKFWDKYYKRRGIRR
jgi:hypothetical protein